jgi:adenosylcobinamide-GDP ribazoletransferase
LTSATKRDALRVRVEAQLRGGRRERMTGARLALGFMTRIPAGVPTVPAEQLSRAAAWFPAVGLLVGAIAAGVHALAGLVLEPGPATVLALAAAVLVTGAFHEDALADTADGLGAHVGRKRKLEIMTDSRVGTYGALAVALPLLFAYSVLAPLGDADFAAAVVSGHVLGRWAGLPQAHFLPPAQPGGLGAKVRVSRAALVIGSAFAGATLFVSAGPQTAGIAIAVAVVVNVGCGLVLRRVLGGGTGDTYGAVNKLTELATYAVVAAAAL